MSTAPSSTVPPWAAPPIRAARAADHPRRPWTVAVLIVLAALLGPVLWGVLGLISYLTDDLAPLYGEGRPFWLLFGLDMGLGIVAVFLLPVALRHGPRLSQEILPEELASDFDPIAAARRREPRSAFIAALVLAAMNALSGAASPAAVIAMISLCSRGRMRWAGALYGTTVAAVTVNYFFAGPVGPWPEILQLVLVVMVMMLVPVLIGMYRWARRRQIRALEAKALVAQGQAAALVREEHARADQSRAQERTRIAREMHDTLSHRLALISTYAGALDYREDLDRGTVRSTARLVQQTAATASAELRTVLDVLRDDPGDTRPEPDLSDIPQPFADFRATGARIEVVGDDEIAAARLPDTTARTLYRVLQEALTNAVKHAPGAPITVRWGRQPRAVSLTVSNPRVADAHPEPGGFGLVGLDERARGLGGTISTQHTETMFRLEACIPCRR